MDGDALDLPVGPIPLSELDKVIASASPEAIAALDPSLRVGTIKNLVWDLKCCRAALANALASADAAVLEECATELMGLVHCNKMRNEFKSARCYEDAQCMLRERAAELKEAEVARQAATPTVSEDWKPTADNINALPEPVRRYIHDLKTNCDPAGMVRENVLLKDQNTALQAMLADPLSNGESVVKAVLAGEGSEDMKAVAKTLATYALAACSRQRISDLECLASQMQHFVDAAEALEDPVKAACYRHARDLVATYADKLRDKRAG